MKNRLAILFLLFFFSGISGLIYEVVWLRLLVRILGNTVYATSLVLCAFMAGLALGSYLQGRSADRVQEPLRLYAILELGIGLSAMVTPWLFKILVPVLQAIYTLEIELLFSVSRVLLVFLCLLIPCSLMGATLPVLSRLVGKQSSQFGQRIGLLYGVNTLGAVIGVSVSGFILIGVVGEFNTMALGVLINLSVATVAYASYAYNKNSATSQKLSIFEDQSTATKKVTIISPYSRTVRLIVIAAFALSGFAALGYEVVWTRILQLFLGTSVYAFSTMLTIYLCGIALGSLWARRFSDRLEDPVAIFAILEIMISLASLLGLYVIVPLDRPVLRHLFGTFSYVIVAGIMMFPVTLALGMLFPVVSRCFARNEEEVGQSIGKLYATNTTGCILGSLCTGYLLIPFTGTAGAIHVLAWINLVLGVILYLTSSNGLSRPLGAVVALSGALV